MTLLIIALAVAVGAIAALLAYMARERQHAHRDYAELSARNQELTASNSQLLVENARLQERISTAESAERRRQDEDARFKALAAEVLAANSEQVRRQNRAGLEDVLAPLRENLDRFARTVNDCYGAEARERFSLHRSIEQLIKTNDSIGREARELARALRGDSKVQGDWGEMILESILEKSGLRRDEEFVVQQTRDAEGRVLKGDDGAMLRPDVVVRYPGNRCLVIDSKVSLTAYTEMVNAADDERQEAADRHIRSVRQHVRELRDKKYQDYIDGSSPDFVLMFIPNEGAYIAAMQGAPGLWEEAYSARVLIVSPTHLVSALRMVQQLWQQDRQSRNVAKIAEQAGGMYDKFVGFLADMEKIDAGLRAAEKAYSTAWAKLCTGRGNLVSRLEHLRELGARTTKRLPDVGQEEAAGE